MFGRLKKSSDDSASTRSKTKRLRAKQVKPWSVSTTQKPVEDNQRGYGRIHVSNLECRLGTVVDISARGLGVIGTGKQDMAVGDISVMSLDCKINHEEVSAWVMCVNREEIDRRQIRYGLRIIDKTKETRDKLTRLMSLTRKDGVQFFLDAA